jgi:CheY-like chemotaxis protein
MTILVVDDEPDVQLLFEQRFRRERKAGALRFLFAFSGEDALRVLNEHDGASVVLILSDIQMPGMSGFELLRRIKQDWPALKVFMVTAFGDERNYSEAMACGADGFIPKPIDFDDLKARILGLSA